MCVILTSQQGKEIKKEHLETGHKSNPDGLGISWFQNGELHLEKGLFKFDEFHEKYLKVIGCPHIVHARYKSSGVVNADNCHPFIVSPNLHFCHNGTIHHYSARIKDVSDTFAFNEQCLKEFAKNSKKKNWWKTEGFRWFIREAITSSNKLALLDSDGEITIINEKEGEWVDKEKTIWASNDSYRILKKRYSPTNQSNNNWGQNNNTNNTNNTNPTVPITPTRTSEPRTPSVVVQHDPSWTTTGGPTSNIPNIMQISPEELQEIDEYLEFLNGEGAVPEGNPS